MRLKTKQMCVENQCNSFVIIVIAGFEKIFKKFFIPLFSTLLCGFAIYIVVFRQF